MQKSQTENKKQHTQQKHNFFNQNKRLLAKIRNEELVDNRE